MGVIIANCLRRGMWGGRPGASLPVGPSACSVSGGVGEDIARDEGSENWYYHWGGNKTNQSISTYM